jgi:hypothetical protein
MKHAFFFVFALLLAGSLTAQSDLGTKSSTPKKNQTTGTKSTTTTNSTAAVNKGACCTVVIDVKSPTGDLETTVWDATPVSAKAGNPTSKSPVCKELNFELVNSKGQAVKGWSVCDNSKCPPTVAGNQAANQKQVARQNRKTVDGTALTATTPVIDATTLAADDYILRARCGTNVSERKFTVKKAGSGLDSTKPGKAAVKKAGN